MRKLIPPLLFFLCMGMVSAMDLVDEKGSPGLAPVSFKKAPPYMWRDYQVIMWGGAGKLKKPGAAEAMNDIGAMAARAMYGSHAKEIKEAGFKSYGDDFFRDGIWSQWFLWCPAPNGAKDPNYMDKEVAEYAATRDKKHLVNHKGGSMFDKDYIAKGVKAVKQRVAEIKKHGCIGYHICDEPSLTIFSRPIELDFSPQAQNAFRRWLKEEYDNLENLNKIWGTNYKDWNKVEALTALETLSDPNRTNFAQWADFRQFMDDVMCDSMAAFTKAAREEDPNAGAGFGGTQCASAVTGYDLWRWSQFITHLEPYNMNDSREIFRSFAPMCNTHKCLFPSPSTTSDIRKLAWFQLFHGDRGCMLWSFQDLIKQKDGKYELVEMGRELAPTLKTLKNGVGNLVMNADRLCEPIGLLYSQSDLRAYFITGGIPNPEDKAAKTDGDMSREGFSRLVEDMGLQYNYVSNRQVAEGCLETAGYKVFFLPYAITMSETEALALKQFVQNGGTLIADYLPGVMDGKCRVRKKSPLDDLFGVSRKDWRPGMSPKGVSFSDQAPGRGIRGKNLSLYAVEEDLTVKDAEVLARAGNIPCLIHRQVGEGDVYYLNFDLGRYLSLRAAKSPEQKLVEDLFSGIFSQAGITAKLKFRQVAGKPGDFEIFRFADGPIDIYSFQRASDFNESMEGVEVKFAGEKGQRDTDVLEFTIPVKRHLYDVLRNKYLGFEKQAEIPLVNDDSAIVCASPYKIDGVKAKLFRDGECVININARAADFADHTVNLTALDAKGEPIDDFSMNITVENGGWRGKLPLDKIDGKARHIIARDIASGKEAKIKIPK